MVYINMALTTAHILRTIRELSRERRPLSASEIAERAGCSVSTVYRVISKLKRAERLESFSPGGNPNGRGRPPHCYEVIE